MRLKTFAELCMIIAIVSLQIQIWYHPDGFTKLIYLQAQQEQKRADITELDGLNAALTRRLIGLKYDTNAIEEYMRHELGVIKPGETFFFIVDK